MVSIPLLGFACTWLAAPWCRRRLPSTVGSPRWRPDRCYRARLYWRFDSVELARKTSWNNILPLRREGAVSSMGTTQSGKRTSHCLAGIGCLLFFPFTMDSLVVPQPTQWFSLGSNTYPRICFEIFLISLFTSTSYHSSAPLGKIFPYLRILASCG